MIPLIALAVIMALFITLISFFNAKAYRYNNTIPYRSNFIEYETTKYILTNYKDITVGFKYSCMPDPYLCKAIVLSKSGYSYMAKIDEFISDEQSISLLYQRIDQCLYELDKQIPIYKTNQNLFK